MFVTELEKKALESIKLYADEEGFSNEDVIMGMGVNDKVYRGVLASLEKKGIVDTSEEYEDIYNDIRLTEYGLVILKNL